MVPSCMRSLNDLGAGLLLAYSKFTDGYLVGDENLKLLLFLTFKSQTAHFFLFFLTALLADICISVSGIGTSLYPLFTTGNLLSGFRDEPFNLVVILGQINLSSTGIYDTYFLFLS